MDASTGSGTERQLGIGVIGCGGIARHAHLPNIARNPRTKLVAVCDIDVDRAQAYAAEFGDGGTTIDGREGSLVIQGNTIRLKSTRINDPDYLAGWHEINVADPVLVEMHYRKIDHLVGSILDDTPLLLTGEDGRDALELVLAVYQSAETRQPVDLPMVREGLAAAAD